MSYCRWSCDDYDCDLYIYADVNGGWTTHVASNRMVTDAKRPPKVQKREGESFEDWLHRWAKHHEVVMEWMETAQREPIGGPLDGESFNDPTAMACHDRALELRALGYRFPDHVLEQLKEEGEEQ